MEIETSRENFANRERSVTTAYGEEGTNRLPYSIYTEVTIPGYLADPVLSFRAYADSDKLRQLVEQEGGRDFSYLPPGFSTSYETRVSATFGDTSARIKISGRGLDSRKETEPCNALLTALNREGERVPVSTLKKTFERVVSFFESAENYRPISR